MQFINNVCPKFEANMNVDEEIAGKTCAVAVDLVVDKPPTWLPTWLPICVKGYDSHRCQKKTSEHTHWKEVFQYTYLQ